MATKPLIQRIAEWNKLQEKLKQAVKSEMALRKEIFAELFPAPREGVNSITLDDGTIVKADHKITRTIDEAALTSAWGELVKAEIPVDDLIKTKPSLSVAAFRLLTDKQHMLFDICLEIKPGAPALEVKFPPKGEL